MNEEAIRFYCGIGEMVWNHHPVAPGRYACVSPVYEREENKKRVNAVVVPDGVEVIQDSGAFSDGPGQRLDFGAALARQIAHAQQYHHADNVTHQASYYLLIDEKWIGGIRYKARWTEADAEEAVKTTVDAARYLSTHRQAGLKAVLSAQGVSASQYLTCAQRIVPPSRAGDIFGLGDFCITGKMPRRMIPVFLEIIDRVIPFLGREQVKRVHIWGCASRRLGVSCSSSAMSTGPRFPQIAWGPGNRTTANACSIPGILARDGTPPACSHQ